MKKLFFTFLISSSFLTAQADPKPIVDEADFVISKMWESFVQVITTCLQKPWHKTQIW